jgi:very-short-patch-repair endonuclease
MAAPKVRVSDILKCDNAAWKQGFGGRISQKHVDFVIVDGRTTEFLLVVELDDRTHRQRERRDRDDFLDRAFAAAGIEVLHVQAAAGYDVGRLRALLVERIELAPARA